LKNLEKMVDTTDFLVYNELTKSKKHNVTIFHSIMKSKSFSAAKRMVSCSPSLIRWAKETRARNERRYYANKLKNNLDEEDFDIKPKASHKPGFWAWIIS